MQRLIPRSQFDRLRLPVIPVECAPLAERHQGAKVRGPRVVGSKTLHLVEQGERALTITPVQVVSVCEGEDGGSPQWIDSAGAFVEFQCFGASSEVQIMLGEQQYHGAVVGTGRQRAFEN